MAQAAKAEGRKRGLDVPQLRQRLAELAPFFMERAEESETLGKLAPDVMGKLLELETHKLLLPRDMGGAEATIGESLELIEMVSHADASTGWIFFANAAATGMGAGYLPDSATDVIFAPGAPSVFAGSGGPTGIATEVEGGYMLRGKWFYGSGMTYANWAHVAAFVERGGKQSIFPGGIPEILLLNPSCEHVTLEGNWDVLGLRGTGSVDFSIKECFVPHDLTFSMQRPIPTRRHDFFSMGVIMMVSFGHAAWAAGVGRRMLDELAAFSCTKTPRAGLLADNQGFWERFAEAEAKFRSARAFMYESWRRIDDLVAEKKQLSVRDITMARLSLNHITTAAADACEFAYRYAGGQSLRAGTMQRIYRDMHAGSQHITSAPSILRDCGRDLLGLAPGMMWAFYSLMDPPPAE